MWNQVINCENEGFRESWVSKTLFALRTDEPQKMLDVGAGLQPYRNLAMNLGYDYVSHDFSQYDPKSSKSEGLQNSSWDYPVSDINCDILVIPENIEYEIIICTEVLEHVPDPAAAFRKMVSLLAPGGVLVISVPLMSLMHQAPFWFQSGLSPQWFEYHSSQIGVEVNELAIYGDYVDYMDQEVLRLFAFLNRIRGFSRVRSRAKKNLRKKLPKSVLESAGFGVVYIGRKLKNSKL
jgi:2-polyprenyl-3-methyl-5-hydroxy-6-metoxy-1,4-benzoquinol methylase